MIPNCGIIKVLKSCKISLKRLLTVQSIISKILRLVGIKMCDFISDTSTGLTQC